MDQSDWDTLPPVLKVGDLAKFLGIGKSSAYELTHRQDFPVIRLGRVIRISRDGLRKWIEKQEQKAS